MPTLTWLTRDDDLKRAAAAPYRLLEAVPELGAGDPASGNMLIQGDNLDALKALLPYYAGRVKCIYIDPPYNTRSAFEHYDDNLQHAEWLAMMYPRLELLRDLLCENGSIWITLDDSEAQYLKVIADEVFGRANFVANIVWQKVFAKKNKALISGSHDNIFVYAKDLPRWKRNLVPRTDTQASAFNNKDNDPRGAWQSVAYSVQSEDSSRRAAYRYEIKLPSGRRVGPPQGRHWNGLPDRTARLEVENRLWFGPKGDSPPRMKVFLSEAQDGIVPDTWWDHASSGTNQDSKKEQMAIFPDIEPFSTPKPEKLISRIIQISTDFGDLVLDSFLGSGTTAAVAHKMGRRYIGIEMGEHAVTHCAPRLRKVIEAEQGGISESVGWTGGGGFSFYQLGEPVFGDDGRINPGISFPHLAAHIWFSETGAPLAGAAASPWLGVTEGVGEAGRGLALLYNGILGEKTVTGGNVLTAALLKRLRADGGGWAGPMTIYGEASRLGPERLKAEGVTFKQTPYDVRAR